MQKIDLYKARQILKTDKSFKLFQTDIIKRNFKQISIDNLNSETILPYIIKTDKKITNMFEVTKQGCQIYQIVF